MPRSSGLAQEGFSARHYFERFIINRHATFNLPPPYGCGAPATLGTLEQCPSGQARLKSKM